jgi:hypothetical protein
LYIRFSSSARQASHCKLKDLDGIRELVGCKALSCVDLQQNKIDGDPEAGLYKLTLRS